MNVGWGGGAAVRQHGAPAHQGQGAVGPPPFFRLGARAAAGGTEEAKMRAAGAPEAREAPGKAAAEEAAGASEARDASEEAAAEEAAGTPEARDASEETAEAGAGAADGCAADAAWMREASGEEAGAGAAGAPEASCEVRLSGSGRREAGNTSGVNSSG